MARTQTTKATAKHLGLLKAKIAKLKRELINPSTAGGGGAGAGFDVARTGVASVGFIGFPSVGKSSLMSRLTGTHSEAADYEFTTLTAVRTFCYATNNRFLEFYIIRVQKYRSSTYLESFRVPKMVKVVVDRLLPQHDHVN